MRCELFSIALLLATAVLVKAERLPYIYPRDLSNGVGEYVPHAPWPTGSPFTIGPNSQLVRYVPWDWTTGDDVTRWDWRINSADVQLPTNLTMNGKDKVAMSAYALLWNGGPDTLRDEVDSSSTGPPKFCAAFLNPGSDFAPNIRRDNDIYSTDPSKACAALLGQQCLGSLESAFSEGFKDDCSGADGVWDGDVPACADTWTFKSQDMTFVGDVLSNSTPTKNEFFSYVLTPHSSDDLSDWWREVNRTQLFVVKEADQPAKLLCTVMRNYAFRSAGGKQFRVELNMVGSFIGMLIVYLFFF